VSKREVVGFFLLGLAILAGLVGFTKLPEPSSEQGTDPAVAMAAAATEQACRSWTLAVTPMAVDTFVRDVTDTVAADQDYGMPGDLLNEVFDFDHANAVLDQIDQATVTAGSTVGIEQPAYDGFRAVVEATAQLRERLSFRNGLDPSVIAGVGTDANALSDRIHDAVRICG
jgi:hypothetical protein